MKTFAQHRISKVLNMFFLLLTMSLSCLVAKAGICDDPLRQKDICLEMKHLHSQLLVLGAQRDLLQVNYPYLLQIGLEIQGISARTKNKILADSIHATGLIGVEGLANRLLSLAQNKSPDVLVMANNIQARCANCHAQENPSSHIRWSEIFKNDWAIYYERCNEPGRNPYACKAMYGMLSSVSSFFTANQLGYENLASTQMGAEEIQRLAKDLFDKKFFQASHTSLASVERKAKELAQLAASRNPETFTVAAEVTQICMQCHADRP